MVSNEANAILEAIRALPREDRVRVVEAAIRELADDRSAPEGDPRAIIGMMADEPDVMDRVCELVMQARGTSRMRAVDG
jgi:hypothetical protein